MGQDQGCNSSNTHNLDKPKKTLPNNSTYSHDVVNLEENIEESEHNPNPSVDRHKERLLTSTSLKNILTQKKIIFESVDDIRLTYLFIGVHSKGAFGTTYKVKNIKTDELQLISVIPEFSIIYQDNDKTFVELLC